MEEGGVSAFGGVSMSPVTILSRFVCLDTYTDTHSELSCLDYC